MKVFLVHHAHALGPLVDAEQPLSAHGRAQAAGLAGAAHATGISPRLIWHSGKLRARQTAQAMLLACNPFARVRMVRGLLPGDEPGSIVDALEAEDEDVMIVGHFPNLPSIASRLGAVDLAFPRHGLVGFARTGPRTYRENLHLEPPAEAPPA